MTATDSQVIVGVALTKAGMDLGQLQPIVAPALWPTPAGRCWPTAA